ncbi:hypothetical protein PENSUB_14125 [Penicillium subrubescens]|uniref:Uncharacterized protein n=1 Tax=Penicillium subrubescens TaxID=1316194 RepID=A0A1Q5UPF5_9EURO|nr:hypothetical protein PENSUB_14125 [Penicillium subrubescens]
MSAMLQIRAFWRLKLRRHLIRVVQYCAADTGSLSGSLFQSQILRSVSQQSSGQVKICTFRVTRRTAASSDVRACKLRIRRSPESKQLRSSDPLISRSSGGKEMFPSPA